MQRRGRASRGLKLPTAVSEVSSKMEDYSWLIYGRKKIGKTSLTQHFDGQLHMMFEPGAKALELFKVDIPADEGWKHAREYRDLLIAGDHQFRNIVIDTGPTAYDRCLEWTCASMGISHPSDESWGKGWKAVTNEFKRFHLDILAKGLGLVVLGHDHVREITKENGDAFNQVYPRMATGAEDFYSGVIDIIAYYRYVRDQRWLQIRGDDYVMAGCRCEKNFLTPDGEPVFNIPMGDSSEEAYGNLVKAFNNGQSKAYRTLNREATEEGSPKASLPGRRTRGERVLSRRGK